MPDFDLTSLLGLAVAGVGLLFALLWFFWWLERRVRWMVRSWFQRDEVDRERVREEWAKLKRMGKSKNVHEVRQAVIQADRLIDSVLKQKMFPGVDFTRRLKFATHRYPELRSVWSAHRLRNRLVHENADQVSTSELSRALQQYEQALRVMGIL